MTSTNSYFENDGATGGGIGMTEGDAGRGAGATAGRGAGATAGSGGIIGVKNGRGPGLIPLVRESVVRQLGVFAVSCLIWFFRFPVMALVYLGTSRQYNPATSYWRKFSDSIWTMLAWDNPATIFWMVVLSVVCALSAFFFLNSRSKVDFYHSMPIRRPRLFAVHFLSGMFIIVAPYVVCAALSLVIGLLGGAAGAAAVASGAAGAAGAVGTAATSAAGSALGGAGGVAIAAGSVARGVLSLVARWALGIVFHLVYAWLLYGVASCAALLTGNVVIGLFGVGVFYAYFPAFIAIINGMFSEYFRTYYSYGPTWMDAAMRKVSPLSAYVLASTRAVAGEIVLGGVVALVAGAVFTVLGMALYVKRPSEGAGKALVFPISKPLIRIPLVVLAALSLSSVFHAIAGEGLGMPVFGLALGGVLSHGIIESIYNWDVRRALRNWPQLAGCLVAVLAVLAVFYFDIFGYDRYIPRKDAPVSAAVSISGLDDWMQYNEILYAPGTEGAYPTWAYRYQLEVVFDKMEITDMSSVLPLVNECVQFEGGLPAGTASWDLYTAGDDGVSEPTYLMGRGDSYLQVYVLYRMAGGRRVTRHYTIPISRAKDGIEALYGDEEYLTARFPFLAANVQDYGAAGYRTYGTVLPEEGQMYLGGLSGEGVSQLAGQTRTYHLDLSRAELEELISTYQREFRAMTVWQRDTEMDEAAEEKAYYDAMNVYPDDEYTEEYAPWAATAPSSGRAPGDELVIHFLTQAELGAVREMETQGFGYYNVFGQNNLPVFRGMPETRALLGRYTKEGKAVHVDRYVTLGAEILGLNDGGGSGGPGAAGQTGDGAGGGSGGLGAAGQTGDGAGAIAGFYGGKPLIEWTAEERRKAFAELMQDAKTLALTQELSKDFPVIDGSTSTLPLHEALRRGICGDDDTEVTHSKTYQAFYNFVYQDWGARPKVWNPGGSGGAGVGEDVDRVGTAGESSVSVGTGSGSVGTGPDAGVPGGADALTGGGDTGDAGADVAGTDVLLGVAYTEADLQAASDYGLDLVQVPVAREAFVFLVNADNPVNIISQDDLRGIYAGTITNWKELGGDDSPILAYTRNESSGSYAAMQDFMGGVAVGASQKAMWVSEMGELVEAIAAFDGGAGAIGYSVYSFASKMYVNSARVKMVAVDGVEPTDGTIGDGTYPLKAYTYLYYNRADARSKAMGQAMADWLLTGAGQMVVAEAGYVNLAGGMVAPDAQIRLYGAKGAGPAGRTALAQLPGYGYTLPIDKANIWWSYRDEHAFAFVFDPRPVQPAGTGASQGGGAGTAGTGASQGGGEDAAWPDVSGPSDSSARGTWAGNGAGYYAAGCVPYIRFLRDDAVQGHINGHLEEMAGRLEEELPGMMAKLLPQGMKPYGNSEYLIYRLPDGSYTSDWEVAELYRTGPVESSDTAASGDGAATGAQAPGTGGGSDGAEVYEFHSPLSAVFVVRNGYMSVLMALRYYDREYNTYLYDAETAVFDLRSGDILTLPQLYEAGSDFLPGLNRDIERALEAMSQDESGEALLKNPWGGLEDGMFGFTLNEVVLPGDGAYVHETTIVPVSFGYERYLPAMPDDLVGVTKEGYETVPLFTEVAADVTQMPVRLRADGSASESKGTSNRGGSDGETAPSEEGSGTGEASGGGGSGSVGGGVAATAPSGEGSGAGGAGSVGGGVAATAPSEEASGAGEGSGIGGASGGGADSGAAAAGYITYALFSENSALDEASRSRVNALVEGWVGGGYFRSALEQAALYDGDTKLAASIRQGSPDVSVQVTYYPGMALLFEYRVGDYLMTGDIWADPETIGLLTVERLMGPSFADSLEWVSKPEGKEMADLDFGAASILGINLENWQDYPSGTFDIWVSFPDGYRGFFYAPKGSIRRK
ncbi:MAG: substrate-binding domain-containing protein [Lachnospiraceae bacterium]|jgi:ABC-type phosphate transport system substrate-binding protein|nr:substrate-binding domain-containing protein [Lachnospiraceae bacterium]